MNLASGNYTVTPSKSDYTFNPTNKSYSPLNSNQDNQDFIGISVVTYQSIVTIDPAVSTTTIIDLPSGGTATVDIDQNTFSSTVVLTVTTTTVTTSERETIKTTNMGIDISVVGQQPNKDIGITIFYKDSDIAGFDETKLTLGRYDEQHNRWITIPSTVDSGNNKIVAKIAHLSKFAVLQFAASANLDNVKVYPNPFNPKKQTAGLTIENLTALATVKIYTIAGSLIRKLVDDNGDGRIAWDGKNDAGNEVASGVYIGFVDGKGTKKIKITVKR